MRFGLGWTISWRDDLLRRLCCCPFVYMHIIHTLRIVDHLLVGSVGRCWSWFARSNHPHDLPLWNLVGIGSDWKQKNSRWPQLGASFICIIITLPYSVSADCPCRPWPQRVPTGRSKVYRFAEIVSGWGWATEWPNKTSTSSWRVGSISADLHRGSEDTSHIIYLLAWIPHQTKVDHWVPKSIRCTQFIIELQWYQ